MWIKDCGLWTTHYNLWITVKKSGLWTVDYEPRIAYRGLRIEDCGSPIKDRVSRIVHRKLKVLLRGFWITDRPWIEDNGTWIKDRGLRIADCKPRITTYESQSSIEDCEQWITDHRSRFKDRGMTRTMETTWYIQMSATYHTVVQDRWWFPGQCFLAGCFNKPLALNRHKNKWYDAQKLQRISSEGRQHNVTNEKYSLRRESFC